MPHQKNCKKKWKLCEKKELVLPFDAPKETRVVHALLAWWAQLDFLCYETGFWYYMPRTEGLQGIYGSSQVVYYVYRAPTVLSTLCQSLKWNKCETEENWPLAQFGTSGLTAKHGNFVTDHFSNAQCSRQRDFEDPWVGMGIVLGILHSTVIQKTLQWGPV